MNKGFFSGKTVLVVGLGRFGGGVDVAKFAASSGARVIVTDLAPAEKLKSSIEQLKEFAAIEFHLGSHIAADFEEADIIVVNPAVTPDNKFLKIAARKNKFITSQINIFFKLCSARIIGITGANGKSTTTALTAHLLKEKETGDRKQKTEDRKRKTQDAGRKTQYKKVWLSGNIGNEPLLTILDQISPDDLVVLELSSFQLEQLAQIKKAPDVALLTNLTPNHLDRYGTFEKYCAAKENIFNFQKPDGNSPAVSIFNAEDDIAVEWFEKYNSDTGRVCIKFSADDVSDEIRESFPLPGRANLSNLAAAVTIARQFGIDDNQIKNALPQFKALPHRLELVSDVNGVGWYNDSKATTPEGAIAALEAFEKPVIIIAGGYDKNIPFDELGRKIAEKAKAAILLGQTAPKIAKTIERNLATEGTENTEKSIKIERKLATEVTENTERKIKVKITNSLSEAVNLAGQIAESGDVVLLSPACASYDMFDNFEQRGREFIRLVRQISN